MPAVTSLALPFSNHSGSSCTTLLLKIMGKHLCIFSVVEQVPVQLGIPSLSGVPSWLAGTFPPLNSAIPCEDADPGALDFVTSSWWLQSRGRRGDMALY